MFILFQLSIICLNFLRFVSMYDPGCSKPLGLMTGEIQDWQLSASSISSNSGSSTNSLEESSTSYSHHVKYARIHQPGSFGWCANHHKSQDTHHWLLVDLGVATEVGGIITQGLGDIQEWTTLFTILYSLDAYKWNFILDVYGNKKMFNGNVDSHNIHTIWFESTVTTRFVKIQLLEWFHHPCLRLEILGCQECSSIISGPGIGKGLTASTFGSWDKKNSCQPEDGHLQTHRAWCARHNNVHQWLQLEFGSPSIVTGIVTRGRGDTAKRQWVTAYTLSYSNDTHIWYFYKELNHLNPKIFGGNMDKNTERRHYLNTPFTARFVRIHPMNWFNHISMRVALLGCSTISAKVNGNGNLNNSNTTEDFIKESKDECSTSHFFRLNKIAPCMENLAMNKEVWSNDKKHFWKDWKYGHVSLAVDGNTNTQLQNCALLDNYYTENPIWMVDLGRKYEVNGVVILTWQGDGQDKETSYREYISNLENVTVFISNQPRQDASIMADSVIAAEAEGQRKAVKRQGHKQQQQHNPQIQFHSCGTISRENNALFNPKIRFDCNSAIGRYIYVKPMPIPQRWSRIFNFVLCEVFVY